jgi:hypothetical protein
MRAALSSTKEKKVPLKSLINARINDMQVFKTAIQRSMGTLSQPNAYTCQATAIAQALGTTDIMGIRRQLEGMGDPGDPAVMGRILGKSLGNRYSFDDNASLSEAREVLKLGALCITHGWFTGSGHVIVFDGVRVDLKTLGYQFDVKDPWSEFDFASWSYNNPNVDRFDGYYSSRGIYAACVAGQSVGDARRIYQRGELDSSRKGMWLHVIMPQALA